MYHCVDCIVLVALGVLHFDRATRRSLQPADGRAVDLVQDGQGLLLQRVQAGGGDPGKRENFTNTKSTAGYFSILSKIGLS